ncbi:electron transport complex subunit RsxG [Ectothiorhodospiraceae bacterium BW-2]|nr:electron transport complex subunit RsxG [Ectothiorhodospiraceae bacterium BW-2]
MLLGGFAALATTILVMANVATRETIVLRQQEDLQQSLNQVISPELYDNDPLQTVVTITDESTTKEGVLFYRGVLKQQVTTVAFEMVGQGYAGDIRLLMGLNRQGDILGVRVLSHAETPGLGDKIELTRDDWILAFDGRSLANTTVKEWHVDKDGGQFDSFSGATITPRAVVAAVKAGLDLFARHQATILAVAVVSESETGEGEGKQAESGKEIAHELD